MTSAVLFGLGFGRLQPTLIKNYRRKRRAQALGGDDSILDLLNAEVETLSNQWHETGIQDALESCLQKLSQDARQLIQLRYEDGLDIAEICQSLGRKHSGSYDDVAPDSTTSTGVHRRTI